MESPIHVVLFSSTTNIEDFSIELNQPLDFSKDETWKVAVTEISVPCSLYNIQEDFVEIKSKKRRYRVNLQDGFYDGYNDIYKLIRMLKPRSKLFSKHFTQSGVNVSPSRTLTFSKNLSQVLNLPESIKNTEEKTLSFSPDIQTITKYICVLSNIVEERIFDGELVPLLISIVLEGNCLGGVSSTEPYPNEYISVKRGIYKAIHIKLKRTDGVPIKFKDNFIMLKMKFVKL